MTKVSEWYTLTSYRSLQVFQQVRVSPSDTKAIRLRGSKWLDEISFGEWLRYQRRGRGLTQKQLAHQIGCATITLRKIESGERFPSVQNVKKVAEIFNISLEEQKVFLLFARGDSRSVPMMAGVGMVATRSVWVQSA